MRKDVGLTGPVDFVAAGAALTTQPRLPSDNSPAAGAAATALPPPRQQTENTS